MTAGNGHPGGERGPVVRAEYGNTRLFIHGLAGTALVDGATPGSNGAYHYGWLMGFSYAVGAGLEHAIAGPFSARLGGDYLHTAFYDSVGAVQPQNSFRITASVVCRLKQRQLLFGQLLAFAVALRLQQLPQQVLVLMPFRELPLQLRHQIEHDLPQRFRILRQIIRIDRRRASSLTGNRLISKQNHE